MIKTTSTSRYSGFQRFCRSIASSILRCYIPRESRFSLETGETGPLLPSVTFFTYFLGFREIGGYGSLERLFMQAVSNDTLFSNSTCGRPPQNAFVMLRDPVKSDIPWPGFILGQSIASVWYWCADQVNILFKLMGGSREGRFTVGPRMFVKLSFEKCLKSAPGKTSPSRTCAS